MLRSITTLLTEGQIQDGLRELLSAMERFDPGRADDVRLLLSRYNKAARDADLGVLEARAFDVTQAQLTRTALKFAAELAPKETPGPVDRGGQSPHEIDPAPVRTSREVFISYKWGGESERLAERVEQFLEASSLRVVRDKQVLGYKADIEQFMRRLSDGQAVVCILSDGYLRSQHCMRELMCLMEHADGEARAFPLVLGDAQIYDPILRLDYVQLWQGKRDLLSARIRDLPSQDGLETARAEIDLYAAIARAIDPLTGWLKRTNALSVGPGAMDSELEPLRAALLQ